MNPFFEKGWNFNAKQRSRHAGGSGGKIQQLSLRKSDLSLLRIGLLLVKNDRVTDHSDPVALGFHLDLAAPFRFLLLVLEIDEFDLDEFMLEKAFADGPDNPLRQPFLADLNHRLQIVGEAFEMLFLKSL
jgi:hypothetical protein